jgi:hypothetical protein
MSGISGLIRRFMSAVGFATTAASGAAEVSQEAALATGLLQDQIPYYLTREAKEGLLKALQDFPDNTPYYTVLHQNEVLQGDAWTDFQVFNFKTGEKSAVRGIILSNTCDIATENRRDLPFKIVFSPIIRLSDYVKLLQASEIGAEKIERKLTAIREQKVTNIFYMPPGARLDVEYIARLDDVHSIPSSVFINTSEKSKIFSLHLVGFHLFLFKISIHFCRFQENIERVSPSEMVA